MTKLDTALAVLQAQDMPAELDELDGRVMRGLQKLRERQVAMRSVLLAGIIAGSIGLISAVSGATRARAAQPLLAVPAIAPSSLLVD